MISEQVQEIARQIGKFYLTKNNGDYKKASDEILKLQITKLEVLDDGRVCITTNRPGLLIGKRGENIDNVCRHLGMKIHVIEEMDHIYNYLIPYLQEDLDSIYESLDKEEAIQRRMDFDDADDKRYMSDYFDDQRYDDQEYNPYKKQPGYDNDPKSWDEYQ